jgi:enoyl-CoA hydratase
MEYKNISFDTSGSVAKIIISRPQKLNAVDYSTILEFKHALLQTAKDPSVRVLTITGSGEKSFVVGADKKELEIASQDRDRAINFETVCREAFSFLANMEIPTVCAINGYAFGLGLQLALACTFRIISSNAKLGLPEIGLGFFPSLGATQRLTRVVGESKASEMILTGEPIDAEEAHRLGLVNRKVPPSDLFEFTKRFAEKLAEKRPLAVKLALAAIKKGREMEVSEGLSYEAHLADICMRGKKE